MHATVHVLLTQPYNTLIHCIIVFCVGGSKAPPVLYSSDNVWSSTVYIFTGTRRSRMAIGACALWDVDQSDSSWRVKGPNKVALREMGVCLSPPTKLARKVRAVRVIMVLGAPCAV